MDPLGEFQAWETCWCGSQRRYDACHGRPIASAPGAPVPPDEEDRIWIAPHTSLTRSALDSMAAQVVGMPMSFPSTERSQPVQRVHPVAVKAAEIPIRRPTVSLAELNRLRFALLDDLGLGDADRLDRRAAELDDRRLDELAYGILDLAKASIDRLREEADGSAPPVSLWAEHDDVAQVIGRTLLWADRYLVPDPLADTLLAGRIRPADIADGVGKLLAIRPLVELGVVAPVPSDFATVLSAPAAAQATAADLSRPDLVQWVDEQLLIEGPTAREALIVGARDDVDLGGNHLYFHSHIDPGGFDETTGIVHTQLLSDYRPDFDYEPWVAQTRRQVVASLVQETNRSIAVAETFGGHAVTHAPFRARLLHRKSAAFANPASALLWADVPWLPNTSPRQLAEIASQDHAVEELRARARRAFERARGDDLARTAESLAGELDEAARELEHEIRTTRSWALVRPAPFVALSVVLGATAGPVGALSALAGAVGSTLPTAGQVRAQRRHSAFALVMAKRQSGDWERRRL